MRILLAQRRDLPAEIRNTPARDPDAEVVKAVAPHPGLSETRLRAMADRHGARVVAKVAANPDTTPAPLEHLARHRPPMRKALREIARHHHATAPVLLACLTDRQARPIAAGHKALLPTTVVELLAEDNRHVVEAASANPSLPPAPILELVP
ncbi:hypothetical protein [Kitasatospora purpeofusca]|uniref:hypothetical protein n=1 Tax=Kitasatospora purpeofusca TaxID=67352 RepID=UPI002E2D7765|nr:hypothetical protein [Kitasatospora purpeofusca]